MQLLVRTGDDGVEFVQKMDNANLKKILSFSKNGVSSKKLHEFRTKLVILRKNGILDDDIVKYVDDVSQLEGIEGSEKFVTKGLTTDAKNFKGTAFEADRAAYYRGQTSDIVIEPIKEIDMKVGNKYIEQKASVGNINEGKLKDNYLPSTQRKFGNART